MKRTRLFTLLLLALALLGGCSGGQEIESCLYVISMAVDPAQNGNLTVTIKALSGTQEASAPQSAASPAPQTDGQSAPAESAIENTEAGYVTLSATADSCLNALDLLGATTPRTLNLSQLQEIVLSRTLAESGATLSILREIHSLFQANGDAVVVVTPDDAGDFIRRQYALFGVRLSKYLQVLFDHFEKLGTIPSDARLAFVISAMESGATDAAAVYAAANAFDSTLVLEGDSVTDRLPGHLPRTSPAQNEYLGSAVFSGPRMVGTLTGDETTLLRLLRGKAIATSFVLDGAMYQVNTSARVKRSLTFDEQGAQLRVSIRMRLTLSAGTQRQTDAQLAAQIEQGAVNLIAKLQGMGSDALGFGGLAIRRYADVASWERSGWADTYKSAQVSATADLKIR